MSNELQVFGFDGRQVRVVVLSGEPWWVAKDVCDALEISNPSQTINGQERRDREGNSYWSGGLPEDERGLHSVYTPYGEQQMLCVNEPGLYRLVFKSRTNRAEAFKTWVVREVLPSIRKNGMYAKDELLDNPDLLLEVVTKLRDERNARLAAEKKLIEQKPLVTFAETCLTSKDSILVRELAKIATDEGLIIGEKRLWRWLREWGLILSDKTEPSQRGMEMGLFEVIERPVDTAYGVRLTRTTKVTPKGQVYIIERLRSEQNKIA